MAARFLTAATAVLIALTTTWPPCQAGFEVITGDLVRLSNAPGSPGGIFNVDVLGRGTATDFQTFCAEMTEHVAFGVDYYVEGIGLSTVNGNKTLGAQAAWLYRQFLDKNLSKLVNYDFAASPVSILARDQANALQLGVWLGMGYLQPDIATLSGWNSNYIDLTLAPILNPWLTKFQYDVDHGLWFGTGDIKVMNLRKFDVTADGPIKLADGRRITLTDYIQDQLVSTPELPTIYSACTVAGCALLWAVVVGFRKRASASGAA